MPGIVFAQKTLTGQDAFTDYTKEHPGVRRHLTVADLPAPNEESSVNNNAQMVARPEGAWPQVPAGFKVTLYADGFTEPRLIRTAPNGDLFLADSRGGQVVVLRGVGADGKPQAREVFASGLDHPFGISFYPQANPKWVYVANTTSLVRFAYKAGDMKASGAPETVVPELPGFARLTGGGHWTRDVQFSLDGKKMWISVGSASNVDDADTHPREFHRADVLEYTPDGKFIKVWASGIRNCVGEAVNPITGELWCSVNERDGLGDNLVPDYITSVPEDSFFGWPWWYMGQHQDPRLPGKHPELKAKVRTPDVLVNPHFASLEMLFYPGKGGQFPKEFNGDVFAAEHGSWNRSTRSGYEVIRVPMKNGHATGDYEDFLTGFVTADGHVWGRPVGVTIANDGSMFVTDDGTKSVWHVSYVGK
ncbi:MAG TPA: PQQ-dependent sugar dehydrogenase [Acidobacteriaceae bacterium]